MSDLQNELENEKRANADLKAQLHQFQSGSNNLLAQIESYKQTFNETMNGVLILRTNLVLAQRQCQDQAAVINDLNQKLAGVNKQLEDATKRIGELEMQVQPQASAA